MSRTYGLLAALVGLVCAYFILSLLLLPHERNVRNDLLQGALIGVGLAFVSAQLYARVKATKVNGWITMFGLGRPGTGRLFRAAAAQLFPGPVNVPEEAMYWWTNVDGAGRALSGKRRYRLRFPPGGLPPNDGFWSITMADTKNRFVANPIDRYCVTDRTELAPNDDGSVDIYLQNAPPSAQQTNWLPAPTGGFLLWLRVYVPRQVILDGTYVVPPVIEVQ